MLSWCPGESKFGEAKETGQAPQQCCRWQIAIAQREGGGVMTKEWATDGHPPTTHQRQIPTGPLFAPSKNNLTVKNAQKVGSQLNGGLICLDGEENLPMALSNSVPTPNPFSHECFFSLPPLTIPGHRHRTKCHKKDHRQRIHWHKRRHNKANSLSGKAQRGED